MKTWKRSYGRLFVVPLEGEPLYGTTARIWSLTWSPCWRDRPNPLCGEATVRAALPYGRRFLDLIRDGAVVSVVMGWCYDPTIYDGDNVFLTLQVAGEVEHSLVDVLPPRESHLESAILQDASFRCLVEWVGEGTGDDA